MIFKNKKGNGRGTLKKCTGYFHISPTSKERSFWMDDKKRKRLVANEIKRLTDIFKEVDSKKQRTVKGLVEESAFMKATLAELKEIIQSEGVVNEMEQGSYSIIREHPALKSYNTTIQRYTTVTEKLLGLLPKDAPKQDDDLSEFNAFLNERAD